MLWMLNCKELAVFGIIFVLLLVLALFPLNSQDKSSGGQPAAACSLKEAKNYLGILREIRRVELWRRDCNLGDDLATRQAAWLFAKADWTLRQAANLEATDIQKAEKARNLVRSMTILLLRATFQSRQGWADILEEDGSRLRAYKSDIDGLWQTYAISVPTAYDPTQKWPLIVSMHGHGWYAPYQGYPGGRYAGAFCLAPHGRGSTDYKDLGELDVLAAIADVKRDFPIDENRVYLTGGSMGGTGSFHLGCHYADQFAAIAPIVGNADNLAWTQRWGWNRQFPGRFDDLREWIQEGHTTRAFAGNFLNLPAYVISGSGDTVVPPEHSRNTVAEMRRLGCNVEYREYPACGHGGFSGEATSLGLAWACGWVRNPFPPKIQWKAALLKHGKAYWLKMDQLERPLEFGEFTAEAIDDNHATIKTANLQAFSIFLTSKLFAADKPLFLNIDGEKVIIPIGQTETWQRLRKDPVHGWDLERYRLVPSLQKRANQEGPINEAFMAPFVLVVGTQSSDQEMNLAWQREAEAFAAWWKLRNNAPCRIVKDTECPLSLVDKFNVILLGDARDNSLAALLCEHLPWRDAVEPLRLAGVDLEAEDIGSLVVYPTGDYGPDRLLVRFAANSPAAAWQMWGRFGNWFNWGVYDSKKYFDYCVFDAKSCSPETMLLLGWFGTDWQVETGKYFLGSQTLRDDSASQGFPAHQLLDSDCPDDLYLTDLMPLKLDQMRGAFGWGRSFNGEIVGEHAIGTRSPAKLEFQLGCQFKSFTSAVRLHNPREFELCHVRQKSEKARFTVYGDGRKLGETVVDWREPEAVLNISLPDVNILTLEVVPSGGPSWLHAGAIWLNPMVKKSDSQEPRR
jgi:acetyl esterase/lipase